MLNENVADNRLKEMEINEILRKGLDYTEKKLKESYVSKGKLTKKEQVMFVNVLTDMANDLRDGGLSLGMYEYFNKHFITLTKEEYLDNYQNILEYLLRLLKEKIAEEISAN